MEKLTQRYGVVEKMINASTLYHAITNEKVKRIFRQFDHRAIYLLIAGTYTTIVLVLILIGALFYVIT